MMKQVEALVDLTKINAQALLHRESVPQKCEHIAEFGVHIPITP